MAHEGVKHDYHLVNPSPWPLIGSIAAVALALGLVVEMKGLFGLPKGTWWLLALGLAEPRPETLVRLFAIRRRRRCGRRCSRRRSGRCRRGRGR